MFIFFVSFTIYSYQFSLGGSMIKGLSLFANVGIGELYLKDVGVDIAVANELLEDRANFYREVHPESDMIQGDITNKQIFKQVIESAKKKNVQFLIATPPCQGFSVAGKQKKDDPRNTLIVKVIDAILKVNPKYAIIENVPQMLKASIFYKGKSIKIVDLIQKKLGKKYTIKIQVMNASDYGTPQHRKRAIVLLSQNGEWPMPEKQPQITVRQAIGHLPSLESGESSNIPLHVAKEINPNHIIWMKHTPTGETAHDNRTKRNSPYYPQKDGRPIKGFKSTYQRNFWDRPAYTITMNNGDVGSQSNVHPGRLKSDGTYSDARVFTIHELLLLSGIPLTWKIPSWASERMVRRVIGEMVPPKLFKALVLPLKIKKS